ncbi:MAG: acetate/propionate family kinase [Nitrospirae bacterium]|nr:acetate/propionate family kinase [Nitrospirota bacterium]
MHILTVNTGSSSVRLALFHMEKRELKKLAAAHMKPAGDNEKGILLSFIRDSGISYPDCVSHRVVHGGVKLTKTCLIDDAVETEIERLSAVAPLHNPAALRMIRASREAFGRGVPQVAVFDTAYYSLMPEVSKNYALPKGICEKHEIRRYGFHGIAHGAMNKRWGELRPELKGKGRVISLQLGAGSSITAVKDGKAVDTSMGFSPLEGLVMATRSGDIDPEILFYLQRNAGVSFDEMEKMLNNSSGLFGLSGISGDMRVLLENDLPEARLAVSLYCYRAKKYTGSYLAVLRGADAILFGGGIGENAPYIRDEILSGMGWCGIEIDSHLNNDTIGKEGRISSPSSGIEVWVIPVDEAAMLAEEAFEALNRGGT